jgi:branched-chain amino acid transport system substrate-binding protein
LYLLGINFMGNRVKALLVILLVAICIVVSSIMYVPSREVAVVVVGDVTGKYSAIGKSIFFGADFMSKELGGLPRDFKIVVRQIPDQGEQIQAAQVALDIVADSSVIAVIGHSSSGDTAAAMQIYTTYEMPIMMPVATNPNLTLDPKVIEKKNAYRLVPQDNLQASTLIDFCKNKFSPKKVDVIKDSSTYADSLSRSLSSELSNKGIENKIFSVGENKGLIDFVKARQSDVIIFSGYYGEGSKLINSLRKAGVDAPILLTDGCFPDDIFKEIKVDPGEIYISFLAPDWRTQPSAEKIVSASKQRSSLDPSFAPFAADSYHIIHDAATKILGENGNNQLNRRLLLNYLQKHREFNDKSYISGPYVFGDNGDNTKGRNYIYKLRVKDNLKDWEFIS